MEAATDIRWAEQPARTVQLLTVPQVARRLNVSPAKVWSLISRGKLESLKIDRSRRVPDDAVDRYVAGLLADDEALRARTA